MSGNSQQRRTARRIAERKTKRELEKMVGPKGWVSDRFVKNFMALPPLVQSVNEVDVAYLEQSILNDKMFERSKDPMWIQAFEEHGQYGKPGGCARCYGKVVQWYKMGKPERKPYVHEVESEQSFEERKEVHRDQTDAVAERLLKQDEYNEWRKIQQAACEHDEGEWIGTRIHHCTKKLPNGESCRYMLEIREDVYAVPPELKALEKRSWLWRMWNFVKRI